MAVYSGERQVYGISHPVEITFDERGIPQVWARTDADAYFAAGWLHASERLFQMELLRRLSGGSLSELLGERAFETDVRQRRIGFHLLGERVLAGADPHSLAIVDAYVAGVNAWISQARVLPPEFVILRSRPRAWTALDVATAFVYQSWHPTELADRGPTSRFLIDALGEDVADLLVVPREWMIPSVPGTGFSALLDPGTFPLRMKEATNNWAVSPARSASGHALHAADPHLNISQVPGLWYAVGLHSEEGLGVVGVMSPAVPVVAMGHNGRSAWSFSVAPVVLTDRYTETFHPDDPLLVLTPDGYERMEVRHETIRVKGEAEPRVIPVYRTPRGVLMEGNTSMHWSGYDVIRGDALDAAFSIPRMSDFDGFQAVVDRFPVFSVNWVYSDRGGTIGYQLGPAIPNRNYHPAVQHDAADGRVRWDGYHRPETRPGSRDPDRGWVATTNNPPAPADWPVTIYGNYNLHRMQRVEAWLDTRDVVDGEHMRQMQLDFVSGRAELWRELIAQGADGLGEGDLAARIRAWSGRLSPDDTLATLYVYWTQQMTRHLFEDELGSEWPRAAALRDIVLKEELDRFIDDRRTSAQESASDISARALSDALELSGGRTFGEVQSLTITHPLSQAPLINRLLNLNRGPFPRGGDSESLNLTGAAFDEESGTFRAQVGPSMRFIMDWAEVDAFSMTLPLGQSGNPFSPHYDDFLPLFEGNEPWTVPFSEPAVRDRAASVLRLVPPVR